MEYLPLPLPGPVSQSESRRLVEAEKFLPLLLLLLLIKKWTLFNTMSYVIKTTNTNTYELPLPLYTLKIGNDYVCDQIQSNNFPRTNDHASIQRFHTFWHTTFHLNYFWLSIKAPPSDYRDSSRLILYLCLAFVWFVSTMLPFKKNLLL